MTSVDDVRKLANLAHLSVTDEEAAALAPKVEAVLEYVKRLQELKVQGVEPMSHVHGVTNVFRADQVGDMLPVEKLMMNVPDHSGRFIRVPIIVE